MIGVVYDPSTQVLYHAIDGQGCYKNLDALTQVEQSSKALKVYADNSFQKHEQYDEVVKNIESYAQSEGFNQVEFVYGSGAVINACRVTESQCACYLKLPKKEEGGGSIWDFAATTCIATEASAWSSNINCEALDLNRGDSTFMNHEGVLFASNKRIAQSLIELISCNKTND